MQKYILSVFVFALVAGCAGNKPADKPAPQPSPKIESVSTNNGKGIPYGRSDSDAPYFKTFSLEQSQDPEYGRKAENPVKTAPRHANGHIWFLNSLRGPEGQPVEYERRGSCCHYEDKSLDFGGGLLDVYEIKIDGSKDIVLIYVDMYRKGPPQIPVGFTQRKTQ